MWVFVHQKCAVIHGRDQKVCCLAEHSPCGRVSETVKVFSWFMVSSVVFRDCRAVKHAHSSAKNRAFCAAYVLPRSCRRIPGACIFKVHMYWFCRGWTGAGVHSHLFWCLPNIRTLILNNPRWPYFTCFTGTIVPLFLPPPRTPRFHPIFLLFTEKEDHLRKTDTTVSSYWSSSLRSKQGSLWCERLSVLEVSLGAYSDDIKFTKSKVCHEERMWTNLQ